MDKQLEAVIQAIWDSASDIERHHAERDRRGFCLEQLEDLVEGLKRDREFRSSNGANPSVSPSVKNV